jgi:hypothetical protein
MSSRGGENSGSLKSRICAHPAEELAREAGSGSAKASSRGEASNPKVNADASRDLRRRVGLGWLGLEVTAAKSKTAKRRLVPISDNLVAWLRPIAKLRGAVTPEGLRKRFDAVKAHARLAIKK